MAVTTERRPASASFWNDPRYRAFVYQAVALAAVVYFGWSIVDNTMTNLAERGIASGFGFLNTTAGFGIIQSILPYTAESTYGQAFLVSLVNTILISAVGVAFATLIGFVVGIARLSRNWLISKIALVYIETFRNIPLLLQILFWYNAVLKPLPAPRELYQRGEQIAFSVNNRGLYLPRPIADATFDILFGAFLIGIVATIAIARWAKKRQMATGQQFPVFYTALGLIILFPALVWVALSTFGAPPLEWEYATMAGFQLKGGLPVIPEFVSLLLALSVYTGAFIAEIVRSGIESVSHGQTEAAHALGLRPGPTLRLIIIPQAMRVIIPPLTSQYLNLTKNSSLATAIAYPDLVSVFAGTVLNQTGQAVEVIAITMAVYLTISLLTSLFMNWYNAKMSLVER